MSEDYSTFIAELPRMLILVENNINNLLSTPEYCVNKGYQQVFIRLGAKDLLKSEIS
jgi:hypothetical protein